MGNARAGRPPKPLEDHLLRGTFKKSRHGQKINAIVAEKLAGDEMTMYTPTGFSKDAEEIWGLLEKQLGHTLQETDSAEFSMLCEMWCLYLAALKVARKNPVDKNARTAVLAYSTQFDRLACRFGLTPSDRARLRAVLPQPRPLNKLDRLLAKTTAFRNDDFEDFLARPTRVASRNRGAS